MAVLKPGSTDRPGWPQTHRDGIKGTHKASFLKDSSKSVCEGAPLLLWRSEHKHRKTRQQDKPSRPQSRICRSQAQTGPGLLPYTWLRRKFRSAKSSWDMSSSFWKLILFSSSPPRGRKGTFVEIITSKMPVSGSKFGKNFSVCHGGLLNGLMARLHCRVLATLPLRHG